MSTKSKEMEDIKVVDKTVSEDESLQKRIPQETAEHPKTEVSATQQSNKVAQQAAGAEKSEKNETPLGEGSLKVLALTDAIYRNKEAARITVLEVKDFLENLYSGIDVDLTYSELRKRNYVWSPKDTDEIFVTNLGQEQVRNHDRIVVSMSQDVFDYIRIALPKDDYLQRILLLAYLNEFKAREYVSSSSKDLQSSRKISAILLLDKDLVRLSDVQKLARNLKKDYPASLAQTLRTYCNDDSFLLALSSLRIESLKESLGLKLSGRSYFSQFTKSLRIRFGDAVSQEILKKLLYVGLTDTDNLFGLDVDQILLSSDYFPKLKNLLAPRSGDMTSAIKVSWTIFYSLRGMLSGQMGYLADEQIKQLLSLNGMIVSGNQLIVTEELANSWNEIYRSILSKASRKIIDYDNAMFTPFFDFNQLREVSDKMICTLAADYLDPEFLSKNVILKLSLLEFGFQSDAKQNLEYNAIGAVRNLIELKAQFTLCTWFPLENDPQVQKAKKIVEDRTTEKITLQEAIGRLEKSDLRAVEMLLLISEKMTGITAIERSYFDRERIWNDVWNVMRLRTAISKEDFDKLRTDIIEIVEKKARVDLANFYDEKTLFELCREELSELVIGRVRKLDSDRKRSVYAYLKSPSVSGYELTSENWLAKFKVAYRLLFNDQYKGELSRTLVQVGLASESTWISSKGNDYGPTLKLVAYLSKLQPVLLKEIEADVRPIRPALEEFKKFLDSNKYEIAALEFILSSGEIVERSPLREYLWGISLAAWNQFQPFEGIVSSKDEEIIGINPELKEELRSLVRERKNSLLEKNRDVVDIIDKLETIDKKITVSDQLGIIEGFLVTPTKEEIGVIVSPWFSPFLNDKLRERTLLMLTDQDRDSISKFLRQSLKEVLLLTKTERKIQLTITASPTSLESDLERNLKELGFAVQKFEDRIIKSVARPIEISGTSANATFAPEIEEEERTATKPTVGIFPAGESALSIDEMIFEPPENEDYAFSGVIRAIADRPICIVAERVPDDDYIHTLQLMCRELYRIKVGGNPRAIVAVTDKRGIEEGLEASNRIFVVDDTQKKFFDFLGMRDHEDIETAVTPPKLEERFRELFSQGYGYIIFYVEKERKATLEKALFEAQHVIPQLATLKLKKLNKEEKQSISSCSWGFAEPQVTGSRLDYFFGNCERDFFRKLQKIANITKYQPIIKESLEDEGEGFGIESSLHYALKFFAVHYLVEKVKIPIEEIQTEYCLSTNEKGGQSKIIPDVYAPSRGIAVEIETLYGTGLAHIRKLARTIEKYQGRSEKVHVVVPNLQLQMFRREIIELERQLKEKANFGIYGIDIQDLRLVKLREIEPSTNLSKI